MKKLFGTDGIRGKANTYPMTPEVAVLVGKAVARVFVNSSEERKKIVIGKDTRLSGYMLESALEAGICSMGVDVLLVGPMPTPAIAQLTRSLNASAGIVLTASHNPANDNGIKIFGPDGYKLPDEKEQEIEELVISGNITAEHIEGTKLGKAFRVDEANGRYNEFAKATIKSTSLKGLKIVLDCAHGAGYTLAPNIFSELGAEIIVLNNKPDGLNINENCGATHTEMMQEEVKKQKADFGIALDGDADRIIMCDEKGNLITGDHILAILAIHLKEKNKLKKDTIVATSYTNLGLDETLQKHGIKITRVQNGDRYVIEEMRKEKLNVGGEQSGHIIFHDYVTTGDGIITGLQLAKIIKTTKEKVSTLASVLTLYPQKTISVPVKEKPELSTLKSWEVIKTKEKELEGKGRVLVRYSGTENLCRIMVEAKSEEDVTVISTELKQAIEKEIGVTQ